jgi:hypothetical protein
MLSGVHGSKGTVEDFRILNIAANEARKLTFSVFLKNLSVLTTPPRFIPSVQFNVTLRDDEARQLARMLKELGYE